MYSDTYQNRNMVKNPVPKQTLQDHTIQKPSPSHQNKPASMGRRTKGNTWEIEV